MSTAAGIIINVLMRMESFLQVLACIRERSRHVAP
jgi:hypothetical protein